MAQRQHGRGFWVLSAIGIVAGGILFGLIMQNVWLGLVLAAAISIGVVLAYNSRRGRNEGIYDRDDDGAQL
jgi:hypothetical protein